MPKVFISYRRADSVASAGRLYDRLTVALGKDSIVMDVSSIPLGVDFAAYMRQLIAQTSVMLVLIGPRWLEISDPSGQRRVDDPSDPIRLEIETALHLGIAIIPVLVDGARLPRADSLPASLQPLTQRNALAVRYDPDFDADVRRLISSIGVLTGRKPSEPARTPEPRVPPTDLEPGPARQRELQEAAARNKETGKPPFFAVEIATRGELRWIMRAHSWSGEAEASMNERADFSGAVFVAPNLADVHLYGTNLSGAILERVDLGGADLRDWKVLT
jgi:TIR domain/Pentapeptide repeats (8 copies)